MGFYTDEVIPLQWAVMDIQQRGLLVDQALASAYFKQAEAKMVEIKTWFKEGLGYDFNPNSSQQVMALFNEDFKVPLEDAADKLALRRSQITYPEIAPIVTGILDYRDVMKKKGTYLQPIAWPDGRVRSQFRTYGTKTLRLSSREPDLQNMPRHESMGINIKNIYCAPAGRMLCEIDKNQLEYRIPAYASNATNLIQRFESGISVHLANASAVYKREITSKKCKEYDMAKRIRYAFGYRAGPPKVSDTILLDTGIYVSPDEIAWAIRAIKSLEPEIELWQQACLAEAQRTKRIRNGFNVPRLLFGRAEDLGQIAYSWPTQATASHLINRALLRVWHWLKANGALYDAVWIVCQIHDSLLFEMPTAEHTWLIPKLLELMDQPEVTFGRIVTYPSEAKYGERWGEMKSWNP
ncbi:DNA polymerase [Caudoviricetes sp.]|nr:DNA polymerase [Caudoviricetes sp.]